MNLLSLNFRATDCCGWPKLRFCIDDDVLLEHAFSQELETVALELDLIDGAHVLEIERYDKQARNIVFVDNQILQDQTVELVQIAVDDVILPDLFKYQGTFYFHDQCVPSGLLWGPNGRWIWHFHTPLIRWLIDCKKTASGDVIDLFVPTKDNSRLILNQLAEFEKALNGATD